MFQVFTNLYDIVIIVVEAHDLLLPRLFDNPVNKFNPMVTEPSFEDFELVVFEIELTAVPATHYRFLERGNVVYTSTAPAPPTATLSKREG